MDDLDALASSRVHASARKSSQSEVNVSAFQALRRPLRILAIIAGPPLLFCLLFFPWLNEGHTPASIWPILYVWFVTPFAAPIGLWSSASAFNRYSGLRGRTLLACLVFLVLTIASWSWMLPGLRSGYWLPLLSSF